VNEALRNEPAIINTHPQDKGWICKITVDEGSTIDGLMPEEEYQKFIA
jgi:glycine cleavage system H protein